MRRHPARRRRRLPTDPAVPLRRSPSSAPFRHPRRLQQFAHMVAEPADAKFADRWRSAGCRRDRRRRRSGSRRPGRARRRRRPGRIRPASPSPVRAPVREPDPRESRTSSERKFTRPRYRAATVLTTSCWRSQLLSVPNQNEITSGRSKRSQTRIAPAGGDLAGGDALRVFRAGQRGAAAVVLVDVGVAFQLARRGGDGELGERPAGRLLVEAEGVFAAAAQGVERGERDQDQEDQPDDQRVAVGDPFTPAPPRPAGAVARGARAGPASPAGSRSRRAARRRGRSR